MTFRRKATPPIQLILMGLGNPGPEYQDTRHNLGFMCVDEVASRLHCAINRRDKKALVGDCRVPGTDSSVLLAKPQTYMNLSGRAAAPLLHKHGLESRDLWVIHDEHDLAFGKLRIRRGGSSGHNGVTSLIEDLGSTDFVRFRLGIGRPDDQDPVDHLLSRFEEKEIKRLPALIQLTADAVMEALRYGLEVSMNRYNGHTA